MSNISKSIGSNVCMELSSIAVGDNNCRGECWKYNLNNQFPIIEGQIKNGKVTLNVDSPHKGYLIESVMKNGKMNGNSRILNPDRIEIGTLIFVDGIANGLCKLYDDDGRLFFEGCFVNGYREGKGKEFDEKGNVIYEGLFKEGKRMNIMLMKEKAGYWKEMNDANEVISICEKNDKFENDGICYFYVNGKINRVSKCKNGEEICVLKQFEGNKMIEFVNGLKQYEGEYKDSIENDYCREGKGKEYDMNNGSLIYNGSFSNGKRDGEGILYENGKIVYDGKWENGMRKIESGNQGNGYDIDECERIGHIIVCICFSLSVIIFVIGFIASS